MERRGSWQAEGPASAKAVSGEPGSPICGRAEASVAGGEGGKEGQEKGSRGRRREGESRKGSGLHLCPPPTSQHSHFSELLLHGGSDSRQAAWSKPAIA